MTTPLMASEKIDCTGFSVEQLRETIEKKCGTVEERFANSNRRFADRMAKEFGNEELSQIAFVPLILSHMVLNFTERAQDYGKYWHIPETKKLSRQLDAVRGKYNALVAVDLDKIHIDAVRTHTRQFMMANSSEIMNLRKAVKAEIQKRYPQMTHIEMRTDAYTGFIVAQMLRRHNTEMDELIASRLNVVETNIENPFLVVIKAIALKYAGIKEITDSKFLRDCSDLVQKAAKRIVYEVL